MLLAHIVDNLRSRTNLQGASSTGRIGTLVVVVFYFHKHAESPTKPNSTVVPSGLYQSIPEIFHQTVGPDRTWTGLSGAVGEIIRKVCEIYVQNYHSSI